MAALKQSLKSAVIRAINLLPVSSTVLGGPRGWISAADWTSRHKDLSGVFYREVVPQRTHQHRLPFTVDSTVHKAYTDKVTWSQPAAYVAGIPGGRVWGRNGTVVTPDDLLLTEVSREFGKREGVFNQDHSIFKQVKLAKCKKVAGTVAVLAAAGSSTYYHWLFDILPRVYLLKEAGVFENVDYFVLDHDNLPFQRESLETLGIPAQKILACNDHWQFHIEATLLLVPSLTGHLGTVSDWTIHFLRSVFLSNDNILGATRDKLYISRKRAPTRKLTNEPEIEAQVLVPNHFREFFAEEHSIRDTAAAFAGASGIIGVHGSGFANLIFCNPGTKVIDIVAPRHVGPYFWMLSNYVQSDYGYLFGIGSRAAEGEDLIKNKVDHDILLDIQELQTLMQKMGFDQGAS